MIRGMNCLGLALTGLLLSSNVCLGEDFCLSEVSKVQPTSSLTPHIEFEAPLTEAGKQIRLSWDVPPKKGQHQEYLVFGFPEAVRFNGSGFLALTPTARAPRSIRAETGATRLIVPVAGAFSNRQGNAQVQFFSVGSFDIHWSIVELVPNRATCTETTVASGSLRLMVSEGSPEIVLQDRFAAGLPKAFYRTASGHSTLSVFDNRYQIKDVATGDLLLDRAGKNPRLSPTGRYVTAEFEDDRIEIVDILAQRVIYKTDDIEAGFFGGTEAFGWVDDDALFVIAFYRQGAITVGMPLVNGRNITTNSIGCNSACRGLGSSSFLLDLDRIAFSAREYDDPTTMSLLEVVDTPHLYSPNRRPPHSIYKVGRFEKVLHERDRISVSKSIVGDNLDWILSDTIAFTFFHLIGDESKLTAGSVKRHLATQLQVASPPASALPKGGLVARRRTFSIDGVEIAPRSLFGRIQLALKAFGVNLSDNNPGIPEKLPDVADSTASLNARVAAASSLFTTIFGKSGFSKYREDFASNTRGVGFIAKNFSPYIDNRGQIYRPHGDTLLDLLDPPIVSAVHINALWRLHRTVGDLILVQQGDRLGTGPALYGELLMSEVKPTYTGNVSFRRIAASASEEGVVKTPDRIDVERATTGAALDLIIAPNLVTTTVDDQFLLVACPESGGIAVFEIASMRRIGLVRAASSSLDVATITLTSDHKYLAQINASGAIFFYSLATGRLVVSGRFVDDELVLYDSALNFEATAEGAGYVFVQIPGSAGLFALDQFSSKLRSSGVAADRLHELLPNDNASLPLIPPHLSVGQNGHQYAISASAQAGLAELRIGVDGSLKKSLPLEGTDATVALSEYDYSPARWISFAVVDRQGVVSLTRTFPTTAHKYKGILRTVTFGADYYGVSGIEDLKYAVSDAQRFENVFKAIVSKSYSGYHNEALPSNPHADQVEKAIGAAADATGPDDTLVLYAATHGLNSTSGFALALPPTIPGGIPTFLPVQRINELLRTVKGRIFIFIDACHGGSVANDSGIKALVESNANVVVLAASKGTQSSLEGPNWGGSPFTEAAVSAVNASERTDADGSHPAIDVDALYLKVKRFVVDQTAGKQTPWFQRASWAGPMSIN